MQYQSLNVSEDNGGEWDYRIIRRRKLVKRRMPILRIVRPIFIPDPFNKDKSDSLKNGLKSN